MKHSTQRNLRNRKRRIVYRLRDREWYDQECCRSRCIAGRAFAGARCVGIRTSARRRIWIVATQRGCVLPVRDRRDAEPRESGRALPNGAWKRLRRPPQSAVETEPRPGPENVKERIVRARGFKNLRLKSEDVAFFDYSPTVCEKTYCVVVVCKNLSVERGE